MKDEANPNRTHPIEFDRLTATLSFEMNSISFSIDSLRLCGFARNFALGVLGDSVVKK
jgi:hypothetical protein